MIKNYAQILNGKVWGAFAADDSLIDRYREGDDAKRFEAIVELPPEAMIGWGYSVGIFVNPNPPAPLPADMTNVPVDGVTVPTDGGES